MTSYPFFSVMGLEIEYMLVNKNTLDIAPQSDTLIQKLTGTIQNEVELGDISLSNELVLHVIELKNTLPQVPHHKVAHQFHQAILQLQPILENESLQLLPTGAHPWMDPHSETQRWSHDNKEIYSQYDKIFDCRGHGWSNLQSMHINLPFNNDEEFALLHNAIRILLPLLPGLAASTPILEGQKTGYADTRLYYYGINQKKVPQIAGGLIPEFIQSQKEYEESILFPMYRAIKPWDPQGILQYEWLNSRTVIPKFKHHALEIRLLDTQECPKADLALALASYHILKSWCEQSDYFLYNPCNMDILKYIYRDSIQHGMSIIIDNPELSKQWQLPYKGRQNLANIWSQLIEKFCTNLDEESQKLLENILIQGNLSSRISKACGDTISRQQLQAVYKDLGNCLMYNQTFA